jgi:hypothetical protein
VTSVADAERAVEAARFAVENAEELVGKNG